MLRKLLGVVGVSSLLIAVPLSTAGAADMPVKAPPPPPVWSWTGWYAGVNLGASFGRADDSATPPIAAAIFPTGYQSLDGIIGGGQVGYNWQSGIWLVGLEADIQGSSERSKLPAFDGIIPHFGGVGGTLQVNEKLAWFDTVRGRLGVLATPQLLLYTTGGLAYGGMRTDETLTSVAVTSNSFSSARAGWTWGSGVEAALGSNWTAKVEYLYIDLGTVNNLYAAPGVVATLSPINLSSRVTDNIVRIGLNYHFAAAPSATSATPVFAAGMPVKAPPLSPPPVTSWTGVYLGINGGGGRGTTDHTDEFGITTSNFRQSGGLVGVTYGGNWQTGPFVLGFEGDFDFAHINGTFSNAVLCSVNGGSTCFTNLETFATDRVRAGIDVNGWLLFGTAGIGYGQVNAGQNPCGLTIFGGNSCNEVWRNGSVAGGGVEKMFARHWSAKVEYLHFNFGNKFGYEPALIGGGNPVSALERGDIVRAGINYHF